MRKGRCNPYIRRCPRQHVDVTKQEIGERIAGVGAGELEVPVALELVANLHDVVLSLAAHLEVVLALDEREAIVELLAGSQELRFGVVTDVEELTALISSMEGSVA
jgi:hypothetical protein